MIFEIFLKFLSKNFLILIFIIFWESSWGIFEISSFLTKILSKIIIHLHRDFIFLSFHGHLIHKCAFPFVLPLLEASTYAKNFQEIFFSVINLDVIIFQVHTLWNLMKTIDIGTFWPIFSLKIFNFRMAILAYQENYRLLLTTLARLAHFCSIFLFTYWPRLFIEYGIPDKKMSSSSHFCLFSG